MTYDTQLEQKIDDVVADWDERFVKQKLFGGIGYLCNGNMAFGVRKTELIVRLAEQGETELLSQLGIRPFRMGERVSMKHWYLTGGEALEDARLEQLLELGRDYALTLPPKD